MVGVEVNSLIEVVDFLRGEHFLRVGQQLMVKLQADLRLAVVVLVGVAVVAVLEEVVHVGEGGLRVEQA